ncbi:immunity protein Imm33 domain-containing protein [Paenibacillus sp. 2TAB26]|uniref:immunity protein Imm33 domain-containing protein n=1 Tax=Paenibacillus sp. 2TAB26 TaxID=3233005 RepID=UPI003F9D5228
MDAQKAVCKKYKADFLASHNNLKLGIAFRILPINGLRLYPEGDVSSWLEIFRTIVQ